MKTPKIIKYCSCGCWLNLESGDYMDDKGEFHKCATLFCPKCGADYRGEAFAARIIRKNREARLKNKIRKLSKALKDAAKTDDFWRNYYKHYQNDRLLKRSIFIKECGTYGQDIEGS